MGYGTVVLEVTVHFSSVISPKSGVGIENMRQEEFIIFFINTSRMIVLVHTAHHTVTDIHAENSINCMGLLVNEYLLLCLFTFPFNVINATFDINTLCSPEYISHM